MKKLLNFIKGHSILIIIVVLIIISTISILFVKNSQVMNYVDSISKNETVYSSLLLTNLNFDIKLNSDCSMEVIEEWEINIEDTNTLFKSFKWTDMKNVKVVEIKDNGEKVEFSKIDEEMYHVTKNCYYALKNTNGEFEIAWGVDAHNEKKKYQISYTIDNAVNVYNDCAELYWQFIGNENSIPIENVTGKIILLNDKQSLNNVNYWIYSNNTGNVNKENNAIVFSGKDIAEQEVLEVRLIMPKELFNTNNVINKNRLIEIENSTTNEVNENENTSTNNTSTNNNSTKPSFEGKAKSIAQKYELTYISSSIYKTLSNGNDVILISMSDSSYAMAYYYLLVELNSDLEVIEFSELLRSNDYNVLRAAYLPLWGYAEGDIYN